MTTISTRESVTNWIRAIFSQKAATCRTQSSPTPMFVANIAALCTLLLAACSQDPTGNVATEPATEPGIATATEFQVGQTATDTLPSSPAPVNINASDKRSSPGEGLHISIAELGLIAEKYRAGHARTIELVKKLKSEADMPWSFGDHGSRYGGRLGTPGISDKQCSQLGDKGLDNILPNVGEYVYANVLTAIILQDTAYAEKAKALLLGFTSASGFNLVHGVETYSGANQCAFELSLFTPLFIESALLLASDDSWTAADTVSLQTWLANEVYPVTSSIAQTRKNNWGSAAAFASWAIGHYLSESNLTLTQPIPTTQTRTPEEARVIHVQDQLNIVGNQWPGDTRCNEFGAQVHGGFPDELRRGSTGCEGKFIQDLDSAYYYQITHTTHLVYHAEALRRHADNELFEFALQDGSPMLIRAITFVTHNNFGQSHEWLSTEIGVVRVAASYYKDPRLCQTVRNGFRFTESRYLPFTRLTYPDVCP